MFVFLTWEVVVDVCRYSGILDDCNAVHESNKTKSASVFTDQVLRARRRIAGNAVYRREVLRFDRDQQKFVNAEAMEFHEQHMAVFEKKVWDTA